MSYVHLVNCLLLTFAPLNVIYKARKLQENKGFGVVLLSALFYILTYCGKTIFMAFILTQSQVNQQYDMKNEILKNIFNLLDCVGILFLVQQKKVNLDNKFNKIITIAIGWSLTESFFNNFFYLFINATQDAFQWTFIVKSALSNFDFFDNICLIAIMIQIEKVQSNLKFRETFNNVKLVLMFSFIFVKEVVLQILQNEFINDNKGLQNQLILRSLFSMIFIVFTKTTQSFV